MNIFTELKRRNVIKVAMFYVIGSWLLLQVGDVLFGFLELPPWSGKLLVALLALGFVPALVFSWVYELTPAGLRKESEFGREPSVSTATGRKLNLAIFALLLMTLGLTAYRQFAGDGAIPAGSASGAQDLADQPLPTIAVLPFSDLSQAGDQEYLGDGVAEEVLNVLAGLDGLKVISRTSAFAFRKRNLSIPEIAKILDVSYVVEGSVRKQGQRVRITAQLILVGNDSHLWSHTYDAELTDIFALQDDIAKRIAAALSVSLHLALPAPTRAAPEWDIAAYELYLRGRHAVELRGPENTTEAARLLRAALSIEPEMAEVWAELATAEALTGFAMNLDDPGSEQAIVRFHAAWDAGAHAVALDPHNSLGWAVQGYVRSIQHRNIEARILFQRALAVTRPVMNAFLWFGIQQAASGAVDDALATFDKALKLDPKAPNIHRWMGLLLDNRRDFDGAQRHTRIAADLGILGSEKRWLQDQVLLGRADISALQDPDRPGNILDMPAAQQKFTLLAMRGFKQPAARRKLIAFIRGNPVEGRTGSGLAGIGVAIQLIQTGPDDLANRVWSEIFKTHGTSSGWFMSFMWNPGQSDLRKTRVFHQLVQELNLPRYWALYGWPPQCKPLGSETFACD